MITVFTLQQTEEWDAVVRSFEKHDVYYLSGYVKAFALHGDGEPILIYYQSEGMRAVNVVLKRDLADFCFFKCKLEKGRYFDVTSPYGYGGFIAEGEDYSALEREYSEFCVENHIVSEFVRFHPLLENHKGMENIYEVIHLGKTVYMETPSEEVIFANMSSKNRNMVRKAQKNGLAVHISREDSVIDTFMEIYNATMDKDEADSYYYFDRSFYESIRNDLPENAFWIYAEKDGVIAAISIFMYCNGSMHYHLSGSRREYQSLAPTNLLLFEAAKWASENGCTRLHLGGGVGAGEDGLYKFKKAFNRGDDSQFYIGKRIFDTEMYEKLITLRQENDPHFDLETRYFPKYRG